MGTVQARQHRDERGESVKTKIFNWPRISSRKNQGGTTSFMVDLGKNEGGKRDRHFFKSKGEAETFAALARAKRENEGVAMFNLPREFWTVAVQASEMLKPFNASILDAAKYFIEHLGKFQSAPTISAAVDELLAEMQTNNRRARTIEDVRARLGHFAKDFGAKRLSEISLDDIKRWTASHVWGARTRIHYLTKLSQLFNFGVRNGYVKANIVELIKRPTADQPKTEILTVEQSEKLLKHANQFGMLPYIAIGLFSGLRSAELLRFDPAALDFEENVVTVGAEIAKKRAMRHVTMNDTLRAWLETCSPFKLTKLVEPNAFKRKFKALRKAAGIEKWPQNGLRHSFASYHLATHGDAKNTSYQLGHRDTNVVHVHYKALVRKSDAERFWALRPSEVVAPSEKVAVDIGGQESPLLPKLNSAAARQFQAIA